MPSPDFCSLDTLRSRQNKSEFAIYKSHCALLTPFLFGRWVSAESFTKGKEINVKLLKVQATDRGDSLKHT